MNKRIVPLLASEKFRDCKYITPKAFFEQAGIETVSASTTPYATGGFGYKVKADLLLKEIDAGNFDGIYFAGGAGSTHYLNDDVGKSIFNAFLSLDKLIAVICSAPGNFIHWGLLKNKKSTGFNANGVFAIMAVENGSIGLPDEKVIIDGLILTAIGPEASEKSALAFIQLLHSTY